MCADEAEPLAVSALDAVQGHCEAGNVAVDAFDGVRLRKAVGRSGSTFAEDQMHPSPGNDEGCALARARSRLNRERDHVHEWQWLSGGDLRQNPRFAASVCVEGH